jgi:hypothetical protein
VDCIVPRVDVRQRIPVHAFDSSGIGSYAGY